MFIIFFILSLLHHTVILWQLTETKCTTHKTQVLENNDI